MITVLRLGHRAGRDPRISTHCALVARAFGARGFVYTGEHDAKLEESVARVIKSWGGPFSISYEKSWRKVVSSFPGKSVHLTMYGIPFRDVVGKLRGPGDLLIVVGGEKVPSEVYHKVDHNLSVTSQPHSEVAALAVFLDDLLKGSGMTKEFSGAEKMIVPQKAGKKVVSSL